MSSHKNKLFTGFLALAGIPALLLSPLIGAADAHAEGSSSYFGLPAAQCVIDSYNDSTSSAVTTIEEVHFDEITALYCADRGITHFRGIVLFPNLETLDLSNNPNLAVNYMDFSQNPKLKYLNLNNSGSYWSLDLSNNPDIEYLAIRTANGNIPSVTFPNGIERLSDDEEYRYGFDLKKFKWLPGEGSYTFAINEDSYTLDSSSKKLLFKNNAIPYYTTVSYDVSTFQIYSRSGYLSYRIFLEGDEEVESHGSIYLNNNCEARTDSYDGNTYYYCNNAVYYGDEFDTDDLIENTLKKIFNLDDYELSKVEIVPPTANIELTVDTDTAKKGKVLNDANFSIEFHYSLKTDSDDEEEEPVAPAAPNTGIFVNEEGSANMANIAIALAGISIIAFIALSLTRRLSARSRARKF